MTPRSEYTVRRISQRRGRDQIPLLALVLAGLVLVGVDSGCALLPQFGDPPATELPTVAVDTTRTKVPDPDLWPTATETPREPTQPDASVATKPKQKTPPAAVPQDPAPEVASAPPDSLEVDVAPAVTVSPPKKALEETETEILASLKEAKKLISSVDPTKLDSKREDKLRIVRGFVTQAEEALSRQDIQAAAGLARKARLLAVELTSR